jgi:formylglycine-generating enzyme required for sulfatase activity
MRARRWLLTASVAVMAGMVTAAWAQETGPAKGPDEREVAALVAQLGDDSYSVREAASRKLEAMGKGIYPMLRKFTTTDAEVASRIAAILDQAVPLWDGQESMKEYARRASIERVSWRLELGRKKVPLEVTLVPAGKFKMSNSEVTLTRPFYLGVAHVTVDQFAAFVGETDYRTDAEKQGSALVMEAQNGTFVGVPTAGASWRNPGFEQKGDHPAVEITWNDARAFCAWASKESGRIVCLPTEAQWEFACRAGSGSPYIWGEGRDSGKDWANVADASLKTAMGAGGARWEYYAWDDGFVYTAPVKSFKPNGFGLYDMIGNAWQWCDDTQRRFDGRPVADPVGAGVGTQRVLRGASWNSRPFTCGVNYRNEHPADYAYGVGGVRVEVAVNGTD